MVFPTPAPDVPGVGSVYHPSAFHGSGERVEGPSPSSGPHIIDPAEATIEIAPVRHGEVEAATARVQEYGGTLTEAEMRAVLAEAGWPVELHEQALAVSMCESRWSPYAVGDSGRSLGLFQMQHSGSGWRGWFIPAGEDESLAHDPVVNARTAWWAYQRSGWAPWSCRP